MKRAMLKNCQHLRCENGSLSLFAPVKFSDSLQKQQELKKEEGCGGGQRPHIESGTIKLTSIVRSVSSELLF